jgi:hypothetical protein
MGFNTRLKVVENSPPNAALRKAINIYLAKFGASIRYAPKGTRKRNTLGRYYVAFAGGDVIERNVDLISWSKVIP